MLKTPTVLVDFSRRLRWVVERVAQFLRQLRHILLLLVFGVVAFFLPTTADAEGFPHRLFGGLFVDLSRREVLVGTFLYGIFVIGILINQALIIDGVLKRYDPEFPRFRATALFDLSLSKLLGRSDFAKKDQDDEDRERESRRYLHPVVDSLFGFPLGLGQVVVAVALSYPWIRSTSEYARNDSVWPYVGGIALVMGVFMFVRFLSLHIFPLKWWKILVYVLAAGVLIYLETQNGGFYVVRVGLIVGVLLLSVLLLVNVRRLDEEGPNDQWAMPHTLALASLIVTLVAYLLVRYLVAQEVVSPKFFGPVSFLLILLIGLVYVAGFFEFWLPSFGIPILLVPLAFGVLGYSGFFSRSYPLMVAETAAKSVKVAEVVGQPPNKNLVVVAVSGGGILSASWSTYWLYQLFNARPELGCELRFLSTVSGGSVGTAHYLAALKDLTDDRSGLDDCETLSRDGVYKKAARIAHARASTSSLAEVASGLALWDIWGRLARPHRGQSLEDAWRYTASGGSGEVPLRHVSDFAETVRTGLLPAFVFNATALESGRRVMLTPVNFEDGDDAEGGKRTGGRSQTLSELLTGEPNRVDTELFTAARASATFPYVTPATQVHSDFECGEEVGSCNYHLVDGGYHDNFGVQTALEFLRSALENTDRQLNVKRILIVEIRLTNYENEALVPGVLRDFPAEWVGPAFGAVNVAQRAQIERNNIALASFIRTYERSGTDIEVLTLQPDKEVPGPLSWHLPVSRRKVLFEHSDGRIITYKPSTMPAHAESEGFGCGRKGETSGDGQCALAHVFEGWNGGGAGDLDCLEQMNRFLDGQAFDPGCNVRLPFSRQASVAVSP